jgi:hypothetical protein
MVRIAATLMLAASTKALTRGAFNRLTPTALLGSLLGANGDKYAGAVMGTEDIMKPKAHGTSPALEEKAPSSGGRGDGVHPEARHSTPSRDAVAATPSPHNPRTTQARPRRPSRRT